MEGLKELRELVGKATGPDAELDGAIERWLAETEWRYGARGLAWTASIDAALGLVKRCLPGWRVKRLEQIGAARHEGEKGDWVAELWEDRRAGSGTGRKVARTAPLAILNALLAASPPSQGEVGR